MSIPEQDLREMRELVGKITPGPALAAVSDTHDGRMAVWADGGMAGATQLAILPPEFTAIKANASFIALCFTHAKAIVEALESNLAKEMEG